MEIQKGHDGVAVIPQKGKLGFVIDYIIYGFVSLFFVFVRLNRIVN